MLNHLASLAMSTRVLQALPAGDKISTCQLIITSEIFKGQVILPKALCPVGQVLWKVLLEEVTLHITLLCSLLHTLLKDECMCL